MNKSKNNAIQGLRFWAITLIIFSHCGFLAQGGLGNNIFFAMSGFFVCQPFTNDDYEYKYFSPKAFLVYYLKRIVRIFPVCWICMLFGTFGLTFFDFRDFTTDNSLLLNMFFIKSKNHLWFLQQEILFYFLAPFLILIIALIKKGLSRFKLSDVVSNAVIFVVLNICVYITSITMPVSQMFRLYGNGSYNPFRLWLFLIGMSFAYVLKILKALQEKITEKMASVLSIIGSIYVCLCLILSVVSSHQILSKFDASYTDYLVGWEHPILITYMASLVIVVLCLLSEGNIVKRFLGNPVFNMIGNVSFSMYLLHFIFIIYFAMLSTYRLIIVVYAISFALSLAIYTYVEKPLINKTKELLH